MNRSCRVSAATRGKKDSEIGLVLVKSIVELHDGVIEARSDGPAKGGQFAVRLSHAKRA